MDKDKKPQDNKLAEVAILAVIMFLFFSFLISTAKERFGSEAKPEVGTVAHDIKVFFSEARDLFGVSSSEGGKKEFSLGDEVRNSRPSIIYDAPGGDVLRGAPEGDSGEIVGGPIEFEGSIWWEVQYEDGTRGFILGSALSKEGEEGEIPEEVATGPLAKFYSTFQFVSTLVSLILLVLTAYAAIRIFQIRSAQIKEMEQGEIFFGEAPKPKEPNPVEVFLEKPGRVKWEIVQRHINSASENDWRLSIIEADILLDEMVRGFGVSGENLGERLKSIDKSDFQTIDKAWEAHKMRNTIAHEGASFPLSNREARRIVSLFEEVFNEFKYI